MAVLSIQRLSISTGQMGNWFVSPLPPSPFLSLFAADWGRRRMRNAAREKSSSLLLSSNRSISKMVIGIEILVCRKICHHLLEQAGSWSCLCDGKYKVEFSIFQWPWLVWNGEIDRCGSVSPAQRESERRRALIESHERHWQRESKRGESERVSEERGRGGNRIRSQFPFCGEFRGGWDTTSPPFICTILRMFMQFKSGVGAYFIGC